MASPDKLVRVGIIGCGGVSQVVHIPTLGFLSDLFQVTFLCDVSDGALQHCKSKVLGPPPKTTRNAADVCASSEVDIVMIANSDAFHVTHTLLALGHNKFVFVEKPMALCQRDADLIIDAEARSSGKVMVGYMRRYAAAFLDVIKEVGSLGEIHYAKVRDITGPNSVNVEQSGTFSKSFNDYQPEDTNELTKKTDEIIHQALSEELGLPTSPKLALMWRHLGGLGSHDLSAMREVFGIPSAVVGASLCKSPGPPFWSAIFEYPTFALSYESGIDSVPRFDAFIEVFGETKTVKVCFDTPFVKGLPTTMQVREKLADGSYRESMVRKTYEDAFTAEMKEMHACFVHGKPIKTTATDAKQDVELFGMIMQAGARV